MEVIENKNKRCVENLLFNSSSYLCPISYYFKKKKDIHTFISPMTLFSKFLSFNLQLLLTLFMMCVTPIIHLSEQQISIP